MRRPLKSCAVAILTGFAIAAAVNAPNASGMTNGQAVTASPGWAALLETNQGGLLHEPLCSAAIVGNGWILTAAHCVYNEQGQLLQPRNFKVVLGRTNDANTGSSYGVSRIVVMPGFVNLQKDDAALIQVGGFNATSSSALPLAFQSSVVYATGGVTLYGYGDIGWNSLDQSIGAGRLWKSPDGAFVEMSTCGGVVVCFHRTASARVMHGDSGAPWLRWINGAWQLIGVQDTVSNLSPKGTSDPAYATDTLAATSSGQTLLQWVRQTAGLPIEAANTIVRNPSNGTAWLVGGDGYRRWIPTGGDYLCFEAQGSQVVNLPQISIDTIAEAVGSQAKCTPIPPPPATYTEQEGHYGANTFTNYHNASGMGPRISPAQYVQVSCKVYDPTIVSANPDGYWYRIASSPWNNTYYAVANTFMNGDPWNGPYTHNTDFAVPNC
jgi:hypothetical protein